MPQILDVEGVGTLEFPDDATPEEITGFLNQQYPAPVQSQDGVTAAESDADDSVDPMFGVSEDEIQRAITDKDRNLWEKINEPRAHIPRIPQQEGVLKQIGAGTVNAASGLVESLTSDLGIALLPLAAAPSLVQKAVGLGFGAHLVKSGAGGIASAETLQQGTEAAAGTALGALMIGHGGTRPGTGGAGGKAARAIDPTSSFAKPIDYTFDPETNIVRTEAGPVKITPEGPRTLTETEIKSQEALGKEVKPLPKDPQLAKAEETLAELDKQGEVPTLAELEASQVGQRAQLEQDFPTKPSPIKGPAVRTAEGVREGKLGQTHAELKLSAAQEGLDFTEGEHIFKDAEGNELTRVEAWQAAKENGQLNEEGLRKANQPNPELESQDLLLDLPGEARRLKLEQVDPDTYQRIEDETILPDHVAFKDPKTNQLFQIPNDATQADLVEILGAVRGEEAAVLKRAELEARTEEVTSRGADEPPVTELPTSKPSGKYDPKFKPPDTKVRGEPVAEPVTSPDLNLWNSPERLQEWLKRESASGTFGKKGSPSGPTPRQAATKAAVEARVAELNGVRVAAKATVDVATSYASIVKRSGFPDVSIAELQRETGMPMAQLKEFLIAERKAGRASFASGDWSLATPEERAGGIPVKGRNPAEDPRQDMYVRFNESIDQSASPEGVGSVYQAPFRGEQKWFVQEGEKRGFGDSIHDSRAEAEKAAVITIRQQAERADTVRKLAEQEASEKASKVEREDLDQFDSGMTPLKRGSVLKQLTTKLNYRGTEITRRDLIRKLVSEGRKIESSEEGRRLINDKEEFLGEKTLTKAGMDYAAHLIEKQYKRPPAATEPQKLLSERAVKMRVEDSEPVPVNAVETYGTKLPKGYVREGDRYVYKPDQMKPPSGEKGMVNLDLLADAGRTFYRKGMQFVEWSRNVLKGLGEKIKPYLSDLWKRMQSEEGAAGGSGGVQRKLTPKQQIQTTIMGKVPLTLANAVSKMTALKERLRGMQEGSKIGALEQRKQVRAAEQELAKNYEEVRKDLIEFSQNLPLSERAKFTNRITTALKPISSLYHKPEVIFDRAEKVVNQITAAVYDVNRKAVIGKIETLLEKNEASKTLNVPQKQAIRLKGEQFNRFKDTMSLDMLETMQERMQEIRSLGKDLYALDEVMKEQRVKATLREITTQGTRKVDAPEQLKLALGETEGWWAGQLRALKQAPASALQRFNLALTPIDWMVQTFDQKMGGAIRRTMKLPIDIKHGDYLTKRQAYKDPLRALAKKHKLTAGNLDRITAHAELRQEGGLENLEAHGFSQKEINSVKTLKRGELEFLRESDRILNELKPMIKAVSEGYFHQEVTDVPGYWPRQRDWSHYESLSIEQGRYGKINRSKPEAGFIQERTGAITYNRMNALEIMEKHIDDAIYHVEMGPEIARIAKVVRSKEFAESTGTAGQRFFSDWVDVLARNGGVESARRSKAIDILVRNTGLAQLALRVTTTGLQPLSIIQGMAVVSPKNMGKAITLMARKDYREFILNNFPEIKNRVGDDPAYASYGGKGVKDTMARAGFYGISRLDRLSAMATGLGAYMDGLETAGLPFDRNKVYLPAMQEAQLAVRKTQSSALPKDVSLAQSRGNLTNSKSLDAALTQFQSFMISKWALTKNGALQLGIKEKSIPAGARIMGFVLLGTIAEQMARDGIRRGGQAIFGQTDQNKREEKQDKKEGRTYEGKILEKAAVDLATSMPVLSNIHGVIRYDGTGIPVVDVVGKTAAGAAQAYTGKKPSTRTKGALRAVQGAGALMGVPTGQIGDFAVQYVDANKPKKER